MNRKFNHQRARRVREMVKNLRTSYKPRVFPITAREILSYACNVCSATFTFFLSVEGLRKYQRTGYYETCQKKYL